MRPKGASFGSRVSCSSRVVAASRIASTLSGGDEFGTKLVDSVLKSADDRKHVHVLDSGNDFSSIGVSFALMGIGVGAAPGPTSETKRGHCEPVERISVQRRTIGLLH
jgi:hypothetical protein